MDRAFRSNRSIDSLKNIMGGVIDHSIGNGKPYNLVLSPPLDDKNEDHAITGEVVFSQFRDPTHIVLEYEIKRYTGHLFVPNLCIGLDDNIALVTKKARSVGDQKIHVIKRTCRISNKCIENSERLFSQEALQARLMMNAVDYGKNTVMKYAEIFRGRFEL